MNKVYFKLSKKEKEIIKKKIKNILKKEKIVGFAYLFGGFVEEEEFRDIDIGVYILPEKYKPLEETDMIIELSIKIEKEVKIPVDIIIMNSANPYLKFRIINGELLFYKNENLHDFIVDYFLREYWDTKIFVEKTI